MIKISFSNLAEARANPGAFRRRLSSNGGGTPMKYGPNRMLQEVINWMHNEGATVAQGRAELEARMTARFPGHRRTPEVLHWFDQYITDYILLGHSHALGWTNVTVPLPPELEPKLLVTGRVARVDLVPGGTYAAWLFAITPAPWNLDPRMPLLQLAVADTLGCEPDDVAVGVYCFKSASHQLVSLSDIGRDAALQELKALEVALR